MSIRIRNLEAAAKKGLGDVLDTALIQTIELDDPYKDFRGNKKIVYKIENSCPSHS